MEFIYTRRIDKYIIEMKNGNQIYGGRFKKIVENREMLNKEFHLFGYNTEKAYCLNENDAKRVIEFLNALLIAEKLTK